METFSTASVSGGGASRWRGVHGASFRRMKSSLRWRFRLTVSVRVGRRCDCVWSVDVVVRGRFRIRCNGRQDFSQWRGASHRNRCASGETPRPVLLSGWLCRPSVRSQRSYIIHLCEVAVRTALGSYMLRFILVVLWAWPFWRALSIWIHVVVDRYI